LELFEGESPLVHLFWADGDGGFWEVAGAVGESGVGEWALWEEREVAEVEVFEERFALVEHF
jgi:hypothetical protein